MTDTNLEAAWAAVHDATPEDWYVGRPYFDDGHSRREQYAFDASETPGVRLTAEGEKVARQLALTDDAGQDALMTALLGEA